MPETLIINGHPNPDASNAGKAVIEALRELQPQVKIRTLAAVLSPSGFDVTAEQAQLREADVVVWHFPFYWYSVPALMKKWIDDVLTHGFAYGAGGTALHGKRLILSFTTGAASGEYAEDGSMNWPIEGFLPPLLQTARHCGMVPLSPVWSASMLYLPGLPGHDDLSAVRSRARAHAEKLSEAIDRAFS